MSIFSEVVELLQSVLQLDEGSATLTPESGLLGEIPEFDSMAVVTVLTALEENYGFFIDDDEVDAETFETVGSLARFVEAKL
jgi:acyl carrier protein